MSVQRLKALPGFCTHSPRPRQESAHVPTSPSEPAIEQWKTESIGVTVPLRITVKRQEGNELGVVTVPYSPQPQKVTELARKRTARMAALSGWAG